MFRMLRADSVRIDVVCWASAMIFLPCIAAADVVLDWNSVACDVLVNNTSQQNPGMASRSMAMLNLAMYDAVNGVDPRYEPFYSHGPVDHDASIEAAVTQAAYGILTGIYPDQQAALDSQRNIALASIPDGPAKLDGLAYGAAVAESILSTRSSDGFDSMVQHPPSSVPGHWEPDPTNPGQEAWGPQWGDLTPFGIATTDDFPIPPPPPLSSETYADAYAEVKALGAVDSVARTEEQTNIGLFWAYDRLGMGTPMRLYNQIVSTVAESQENDIHENSRLFAMVFTAAADAGIAAWDSKFEYDFWRPISGIRRGDEDDNPLTDPDPSWTPLGAPGGIGPNGEVINDFTPPFPTYVSGHASFGGAVFQTLENFYGTDDITFQVSSDEVPGHIREFERFSDAMAENGRSRVYLGIHWNYDDTVARHLGADIANYIGTTHFHAVPEPSSMIGVALGLFLTYARARRQPLK